MTLPTQNKSIKWPDPQGPILATPFQLSAEKLALKIMARADVKAAVDATHRNLLKDPAAQRPEGRAALDRAVALWLADLTLREIAFEPTRPHILHSPAIRPRTWHGHTFPGAGTAGDSPDNVQRSAFLHGRYKYVLTGLVPKNPPAQFTLAFTPDYHASFGVGRKEALPYDRGLGMLRDQDLEVEGDGRLTITIDNSPAGERRNHFQIPEIPIDIWFRENLSDWHQEPLRWEIFRVDDLPAEPPLTEDEIAQRVIEGHNDLANHWAGHKERFFSHPPVNTLGGPMYRKGGWGYLSFGFFDLQDDEAILARIDNAEARYYSFQVLDRWYLALDRGPAPISRNNSQIAPNPDGSVSYVLSLKDSGTANWIDTGGVHHGIVLLRWQGLDPNAAPRILEYRKINLRDLAALFPADAPRVSPEQRIGEIDKRAAEIDLRYRR